MCFRKYFVYIWSWMMWCVVFGLRSRYGTNLERWFFVWLENVRNGGRCWHTKGKMNEDTYFYWRYTGRHKDFIRFRLLLNIKEVCYVSGYSLVMHLVKSIRVNNQENLYYHVLKGRTNNDNWLLMLHIWTLSPNTKYNTTTFLFIGLSSL